jgi:hypothetical protein
MAWLGTLFAGVKYATSGSSTKPTATATPPINASSSDEADFIKCANSPGGVGILWTNTTTGTSLTSRTRRTRQLYQGQWSCGYLDAVYVYKSWKHKLSIEPDSRIQIPTKAGFANRGMTILKNDFLHL